MIAENMEVAIADRNPNVARFLGRQLSDLGFTVSTAQSGDDLCLLLTREDWPRLVLLDADLMAAHPGLETVLEERRRQGMKLIVHRLEDEEPLPATQMARVDAVITKTGDLTPLIETVASLLQR